MKIDFEVKSNSITVFMSARIIDETIFPYEIKRYKHFIRDHHKYVSGFGYSIVYKGDIKGAYKRAYREARKNIKKELAKALLK